MNPSHLLFYFCAVICFHPAIQSPTALILGFSLSSFGLVPKHLPLAKWSKRLLAISIVGLGFGIQINAAIETIQQGFILIVVSLIATIIIGWYLGRLFAVPTQLRHLISCGTAICGGSAIAAVGPAINAKPESMSIALATTFFLNAIALFIFPIIGHALQLDQQTFGLWSAIAIHDTSSVVGAAGAYGEQALQVATTTKLARALWIIPVAFISSLVFRQKGKTVAIPMFTLGYIATMLLSSYLPAYSGIYSVLFNSAKQLLVVALFTIGANITVDQFRQAGFRPLVLAVCLWAIISGGSLIYLMV
ncbi:YeiH family protein [Thaumasiovibrio sp. DFM-14]|uniref:YeiH family protein n=1 Tax=Thaumasiovibrio sp. DFM-14 TaxID=3384792 RepID=UPI0039A31CE9